MKKSEIRTEMLRHLDSIKKSTDEIQAKFGELESMKNRIKDLENKVESLSFLVGPPFKFKVGDLVVVGISLNDAPVYSTSLQKPTNEMDKSAWVLCEQVIQKGKDFYKRNFPNMDNEDTKNICHYLGHAAEGYITQ
jgi:hypothetical protein